MRTTPLTVRGTSSSRRVAILIIVALVMPSMMLGCGNAAEHPQGQQLQNSLDADNAKIAQLQSQVDVLQAKNSEQESTITDMSREPDKTPWYQKLLVWLEQTLGKWVADEVMQWVGDFLKALAA